MASGEQSADWLAAPQTPLQRYLAACHRYYIACRDGRPADECARALAEAKALETSADA